MTEIAVAWGTTTVGAEFDVQLGKMLDSAKNTGVLKPYIGNRAVQWGRIDLSAAGMVPLTHRDTERFRLRKGDLLVCEGGEVGRGALWEYDVECYYQKALHRLRTRRGYSPRVLLALLELRAQSGGFADHVTQTSIAHLPREKFVGLPIPAIPQAEQIEISQTLGEVDRLVESIERLIAKKRAIKQGLMQELLTGRTRLPGFSDEWMDLTIASLAQAVGGSTPSTRVPAYWGGDIPWFTPAEIAASGSGLVSRSERSITRDGLAKSGTNLLPAGTVLVTSRASIGNTAVAAIPVTTNQGFASLVPSSPKSTWFLYYWIQQNRTELESRSAGSTFLEISARKVAAIPIKAPSLGEQEAIGRVLQDADAEIEALERRLEATRAIKQGMMQELLTGRTRLVGEGAA